MLGNWHAAMGAKQPKAVRLGPPLSLRALGLTPESSLEEALRALLRTREEIQGIQQPKDKEGSGEVRQRRSTGSKAVGSNSEAPADSEPNAESALPPKDQLYVLLDQGDGSEPEVLGDRPAKDNGGQSLSDLGVAPEDEDGDEGADDAGGQTLRLCLGGPATAAAGKLPWSRRFRACCSRRSCTRRLRKHWRHLSTRLWEALPETCKARLKPMAASWRFYILCARIAMKFLWQDRHEMLQELRSALFVDLCAPEGLPPCRWTQVAEELRPFAYTFVVILLFTLWDVGAKVAWAPKPPMNLTLA